jgi:hypothetical protein
MNPQPSTNGSQMALKFKYRSKDEVPAELAPPLCAEREGAGNWMSSS